MDRFWAWLARRLPKRLAYWAAIQAMDAEDWWTCGNCRYSGLESHSIEYDEREVRCPNCGCPDGYGFGLAFRDPRDLLYERTREVRQ